MILAALLFISRVAATTTVSQVTDDYVVVHELCHLRVADHSPRFWALVEHHRPDWRPQRDWLREYGAELLAFSPADLPLAP